MNKNALCILTLCVFAAGCAQPVVTASQRFQIRACHELPDIDPCNNPENDPKANINVAGAILTVSPPNVCAEPGSTIVFTLKPPNGAPEGTISVFPKILTDTWLVGTNSPDKNKIGINVPKELPVGEYDYSVVATDGRCTDPRIHVK